MAVSNVCEVENAVAVVAYNACLIEEKAWKTSSSRKEINALSYLEGFLSGRSLVWKDISLPT